MITSNAPSLMCRVGQNRICTPYAVYDRIFGDFPAKMPYIHRK